MSYHFVASTLQRRLPEENTTSYAALGFSETANFYPAFKRWSGM